MKFSDLFLPKIARSDPKVRTKAVKAESNKELLKQVIKKDSHPEVREAAKNRLKELGA
ncbi:MAG: hypothetical protein MUD09_04465 [Desulfobacterales bacterium]|jgi:hypothetical protein|nr:hypothetical protein [Desulfobacterales bacterium]